MKDVGHHSLICFPNVLETKRHDFITKGSQRCYEGYFMLVMVYNFDLIVVK